MIDQRKKMILSRLVCLMIAGATMTAWAGVERAPTFDELLAHFHRTMQSVVTAEVSPDRDKIRAFKILRPRCERFVQDCLRVAEAGRPEGMCVLLEWTRVMTGGGPLRYAHPETLVRPVSSMAALANQVVTHAIFDVRGGEGGPGQFSACVAEFRGRLGTGHQHDHGSRVPGFDAVLSKGDEGVGG